MSKTKDWQILYMVINIWDKESWKIEMLTFLVNFKHKFKKLQHRVTLNEFDNKMFNDLIWSFLKDREFLKKLDAVSKSMKFDVVWISIKLAVKSEK